MVPMEYLNDKALSCCLFFFLLLLYIYPVNIFLDTIVYVCNSKDAAARAFLTRGCVLWVLLLE